MKSKITLLKNLLISSSKSQFYKLNFGITSRCNLRCKTCNIWKTPSKKSNKELTIKEIKKIFKSLPSNFSWLTISGGEPFLRKDFVDIIKIAKQELPSLSIISINTNGTLKKEIISSLNQITLLEIPNIYLTFSIDGPKEIHDKVRGIKGSFEKTWDTYMKVKKLFDSNSNIKISIETTISDYNINYLHNFFKKLLKEHNLIVTVAHEAYQYQNQNHPKLLSSAHIPELKRIVKLISKNLNILKPDELLQSLYLNKIKSYLKARNKKIIPCVAGSFSFAMNPFGDVTPCFMWGEILGNARDYDYDLNQVAKLSQIKKIKSSIKNNKCPNCWTPCNSYENIFWNLFKYNGLRNLIKLI